MKPEENPFCSGVRLARWESETRFDWEGNVSLSRKRKKELRRLQNDATKLWEAQQGLAGEAAYVARQAGQQLNNFGREQVLPAIQDAYEHRVVPVVDRGVKISRHIVDNQVAPAIGGVVGTALSAWDVANTKRQQIAHQRFGAPLPQPVVVKKSAGLGTVVAVILGVGAAVAVLYAAWQTLRADDELWVADDPLSAPGA